MAQDKNIGIQNIGKKSSDEKLIPFLAYSKLNRIAVREFAAKLKAEGWIDPWFDEEDILPGQVWQNSVIMGVRKSHAVIIFLSKDAVASEGFFHREIKLALDTAAEKPEEMIFIIPIRLDECVVPEMLRKYHYVDYFGKATQKERVYSSLLLSLKLRAENLGIEI